MTDSRSNEIFNKEEALENVGGMEDLLQDLARTLSQEIPNLLKAAHRGIADNDPQAVNAAAHSIKGSVTPFAASASYEAAWELEQAAKNAELNDASRLYSRLETELKKLLEMLTELSSLSS